VAIALLDDLLDDDDVNAAAAVEELPHDEQGRLLRPGVVWFNENLDDGVIDRIDDELDETDLLLIVGEGYAA
jgi:NAD-dependent SIR2 family protein deacetylase